MTARCEDCRWWDCSTQKAGTYTDTTGLCRQAPPVADERDGTARWPFTEDTDWCGSFVKALTAAPAAPVETDVMGRSVMQRFLAAAGWDAGSLCHKQLEDALDGAHLQIVPKVRPESASREAVLEAQGTIEQLEKQLAFERKKSEPNFLHAGSTEPS